MGDAGCRRPRCSMTTYWTLILTWAMCLPHCIRSGDDGGAYTLPFPLVVPLVVLSRLAWRPATSERLACRDRTFA